MERIYYVAQKIDEHMQLVTGMYSQSDAYADPRIAAELGRGWAKKYDVRRWAIVECIEDSLPPLHPDEGPGVRIRRAVLALQGDSARDLYPAYIRTQAEQALDVAERTAKLHRQAAEDERKASGMALAKARLERGEKD